MKKRTYKSLEEAKEFVQSLGLKSQTEWKKYCKSGNKPDDVPSELQLVYKSEWKSWDDFLGKESFDSAKSSTIHVNTHENSLQAIGRAERLSRKGAGTTYSVNDFAQSLKLKQSSEWKKFE